MNEARLPSTIHAEARATTKGEERKLPLIDKGTPAVIDTKYVGSDKGPVQEDPIYPKNVIETKYEPELESTHDGDSETSGFKQEDSNLPPNSLNLAQGGIHVQHDSDSKEVIHSGNPLGGCVNENKREEFIDHEESISDDTLNACVDSISDDTLNACVDSILQENEAQVLCQGKPCHIESAKKAKAVVDGNVSHESSDSQIMMEDGNDGQVCVFTSQNDNLVSAGIQGEVKDIKTTHGIEYGEGDTHDLHGFGLDVSKDLAENSAMRSSYPAGSSENEENQKSQSVRNDIVDACADSIVQESEGEVLTKGNPCHVESQRKTLSKLDGNENSVSQAMMEDGNVETSPHEDFVSADTHGQEQDGIVKKTHGMEQSEGDIHVLHPLSSDDNKCLMDNKSGISSCNLTGASESEENQKSLLIDHEDSISDDMIVDCVDSIIQESKSQDLSADKPCHLESQRITQRELDGNESSVSQTMMEDGNDGEVCVPASSHNDFISADSLGEEVGDLNIKITRGMEEIEGDIHLLHRLGSDDSKCLIDNKSVISSCNLTGASENIENQKSQLIDHEESISDDMIVDCVDSIIQESESQVLSADKPCHLESQRITQRELDGNEGSVSQTMMEDGNVGEVSVSTSPHGDLVSADILEEDKDLSIMSIRSTEHAEGDIHVFPGPGSDDSKDLAENSVIYSSNPAGSSENEENRKPQFIDHDDSISDDTFDACVDCILQESEAQVLTNDKPSHIEPQSNAKDMVDGNVSPDIEEGLVLNDGQLCPPDDEDFEEDEEEGENVINGYEDEYADFGVITLEVATEFLHEINVFLAEHGYSISSWENMKCLPINMTVQMDVDELDVIEGNKESDDCFINVQGNVERKSTEIDHSTASQGEISQLKEGDVKTDLEIPKLKGSVESDVPCEKEAYSLIACDGADSEERSSEKLTDACLQERSEENDNRFTTSFEVKRSEVSYNDHSLKDFVGSVGSTQEETVVIRIQGEEVEGGENCISRINNKGPGLSLPTASPLEKTSEAPSVEKTPSDNAYPDDEVEKMITEKESLDTTSFETTTDANNIIVNQTEESEKGTEKSDITQREHKPAKSKGNDCGSLARGDICTEALLSHVDTNSVLVVEGMNRSSQDIEKSSGDASGQNSSDLCGNSTLPHSLMIPQDQMCLLEKAEINMADSASLGGGDGTKSKNTSHVEEGFKSSLDSLDSPQHIFKEQTAAQPEIQEESESYNKRHIGNVTPELPPTKRARIVVNVAGEIHSEVIKKSDSIPTEHDTKEKAASVRSSECEETLLERQPDDFVNNKYPLGDHEPEKTVLSYVSCGDQGERRISTPIHSDGESIPEFPTDQETGCNLQVYGGDREKGLEFECESTDCEMASCSASDTDEQQDSEDKLDATICSENELLEGLTQDVGLANKSEAENTGSFDFHPLCDSDTEYEMSPQKDNIKRTRCERRPPSLDGNSDISHSASVDEQNQDAGDNVETMSYDDEEEAESLDKPKEDAGDDTDLEPEAAKDSFQPTTCGKHPSLEDNCQISQQSDCETSPASVGEPKEAAADDLDETLVCDEEEEEESQVGEEEVGKPEEQSSPCDITAYLPDGANTNQTEQLKMTVNKDQVSHGSTHLVAPPVCSNQEPVKPDLPDGHSVNNVVSPTPTSLPECLTQLLCYSSDSDSSDTEQNLRGQDGAGSPIHEVVTMKKDVHSEPECLLGESDNKIPPNENGPGYDTGNGACAEVALTQGSIKEHKDAEFDSTGVLEQVPSQSVIEDNKELEPSELCEPEECTDSPLHEIERLKKDVHNEPECVLGESDDTMPPNENGPGCDKENGASSEMVLTQVSVKEHKDTECGDTSLSQVEGGVTPTNVEDGQFDDVEEPDLSTSKSLVISTESASQVGKSPGCSNTNPDLVLAVRSRSASPVHFAANTPLVGASKKRIHAATSSPPSVKRARLESQSEDSMSSLVLHPGIDDTSQQKTESAQLSVSENCSRSPLYTDLDEVVQPSPCSFEVIEEAVIPLPAKCIDIRPRSDEYMPDSQCLSPVIPYKGKTGAVSSIVNPTDPPELPIVREISPEGGTTCTSLSEYDNPASKPPTPRSSYIEIAEAACSEFSSEDHCPTQEYTGTWASSSEEISSDPMGDLDTVEEDSSMVDEEHVKFHDQNLAQGPGRVRHIIGHIQSRKQARLNVVVKKEPTATKTKSVPKIWRNEAHNDYADLYAQRVKDIVCRAKETLSNNENLSEVPRVGAWLKEMETMVKKAVVPCTVVAVVGDTGSGKSSLMNALLGHAAILPTSGMRACTAVVVEIQNNMDDNETYIGEIEFLEKNEWLSELRQLLQDLQGPDGIVRARQPEANRDSNVSWSKIRAVYGPFKDGTTFEDLERKKTVTRMLGQKITIRKKDVIKFRDSINRFIEATDAGSGGQHWPIVRRVRLKIPCSVCSSGATLVDLPGIRDSNAARDKIAKEYLQNCNAVWVVANIHRAVDNKTAKEMLGEQFRRQLLMDGQYGSVSFICTKTDDLCSSELRRSLNVDYKIAPHEEAMNELDAEDQRYLSMITAAEEEIAELKKEIKDKQQQCLQMKNDLDDLSKADDSGEREGVKPEDMKIAMKYLEEQMAEVALEIMELTSTAKKKLQETDDHKKRRLELDAKNKISILRRTVAAICANARNDYAKRQIRIDFKAGLREMKRRVRSPEDEDDEEEEDDELSDLSVDDDDGDEINLTAENLKVFCVSSTEYLKIAGCLPRIDGDPNVFQSLDESGIPALENHVHLMTKVRRRTGIKRMVTCLAQMISDIYTYLTSEGVENIRGRQNAQKVIGLEINEFRNKDLEQILELTMHRIGESIGRNIHRKIKSGSKLAIDSADATVSKWNSKVNKQDRKQGGLHLKTYQCVVKHFGSYNSPSAGRIDFNEELADPIYTSIKVAWDNIFNIVICRHLSEFSEAIAEAVSRITPVVTGALIDLGLAANLLHRCGRRLVQRVQITLEEHLYDVKHYIMEQQREINRTLTPSVQSRMTPVYLDCSKESGKGTHERMKAHMSNYVHDEKHIIFDEASAAMIRRLTKLEADIQEKLEGVVKSVMEDCVQVYEPIWEANIEILRDAYLQDIIDLVYQVDRLAEEAGVTLPEAFSHMREVELSLPAVPRRLAQRPSEMLPIFKPQCELKPSALFTEGELLSPRGDWWWKGEARPPATCLRTVDESSSNSSVSEHGEENCTCHRRSGRSTPCPVHHLGFAGRQSASVVTGRSPSRTSLAVQDLNPRMRRHSGWPTEKFAAPTSRKRSSSERDDCYPSVRHPPHTVTGEFSPKRRILKEVTVKSEPGSEQPSPKRKLPEYVFIDLTEDEDE